MITGAHAILYSDDADATRAALAKVLSTRSVDTGGGWLLLYGSSQTCCSSSAAAGFAGPGPAARVWTHRPGHQD